MYYEEGVENRETGDKVTHPFPPTYIYSLVMQSRGQHSDFYQLKTPSLLPLLFNSEKDQRGDHQTL